jgi:MoaA/NifB/PqqE/SkfB family radical SAM enzyme
VYCNPEFSSKWASEHGVVMLTPVDQQVEKFKQYIFRHAPQLKHVYLAGGEPVLMKENLEFLTLLKKVNPGVNLRVNTNLSKMDTRIFELICEFKNVHWIVSVESTDAAYDYIRYGGSWNAFCNNLKELKKTTDHKISFNMLYFVLNYIKLFDCVDFLRGAGFHENSFVIGPLYGPEYLNILNLPQEKIDQAKKILENRIQSKPGYFLQDSYSNLLKYLDTPYEKNLQSTFDGLTKLDTVDSTGSRMVTVRTNMTPDDYMSIKSVIFLPEPIIRFSKINLPGTSILDKVNLNNAFINYWQFLRKNTNVKLNFIDNFELIGHLFGRVIGDKHLFVDEFFKEAYLKSTVVERIEKKEVLSLLERTFHCENCGFEMDRDLNAAINLSRQALA